jgi:hypothetical protein
MRVPLRGGLSLISPAPLTQPGRLKSCLNYEVTTRDGYSRIAGFLRYDGSSEPGQFRIIRIEGDYLGESFEVGDAVFTLSGLVGEVIATGEVDAVPFVFVAARVDSPLPGVSDVLEGTDSGAQMQVTAASAEQEPEGLQSDLNAALERIEANAASQVGEVPGRPGSDVLGIFSRGSDRYAIRDLPRIYFSGGTYTDTQEGTAIEIDGEDYEVLDVRLLDENFGFIVYDPEPGYVGTPIAAATGSPVLAIISATGSFPDAYQTVPYSQSLSVSGGIAPLSYSIVGDAPEDFPLSAVDLSAIAMQSEATAAGVWQATALGWLRVDLGREIAFTDGQPVLENFIRSTFLRESGGVKSSTSNTFNYVNSVNTSSFKHIVFKDFGFDIPAGAEVVGITVEITRGIASPEIASDVTVHLVGSPTGSENKARGDEWAQDAQTSQTYGGPSDLWGLPDLNTIINTEDFGVVLVAAQTATATISSIEITVHYIERGIPIYFWDGTTDVEATLIHYQATSGDVLDGDAAGYMTITGIDPHSLRSRQVNAGEEIRTGESGGGDLLALTASRDRRIFMAGQQEVDNNRSRYQFIETNFYGEDRFSAVYGVSGAGPAFYFDGDTCIKIRTPLPASADIPRHIARHGSSLALGFLSGAVVFSRVGDPFETRGALGAFSTEVGDQLTNLVPLTGDALGVIGKESSYALRGQTSESIFKSTISERRGGLEYTAADMGRVILCDSFGIFAADSEEQFGPAERNYLSVDVEPWLKRRLQALSNGDQAAIRPIAALPVRGKSQYRLFFWDGWILTMTVKAGGIEFTTQQITAEVADQDFSRPLPVRALHSMIDQNGRERLYASFYGAVKGGFVFELDVGRSFDGEAIPHEIELVPLTPGPSAQLDQYDRVFVYGTAHGYANLEASRQVNYGKVDASKALPFSIGMLDADASTEQTPVRGVVDFPIEGYDMTLRISGSSQGQGEHCLQMLEMVTFNRGVSRGNRG